MQLYFSPLSYLKAPPGTRPLMNPDPYSARSEEHTSELQSLMRISYAVFCLKKNIFTTYFLPEPSIHSNFVLLLSLYDILPQTLLAPLLPSLTHTPISYQ